MNNVSLFNNSDVLKFECSDATITYRKFGSGRPMLFIHGFPVHGYTWRHLVPQLSENYTCYVIDLPGLGLSEWSDQTDFHFKAQTERVVQFISSKINESLDIIAHDTGATIARLVAISGEVKVKNLVLFNSEVPGHRPPWIEFYQKASVLPLSSFVFNMSLKNKYFIRSGMGLGAFYADKKLLDEEKNIGPYIDSMTSTNRKMKGALSYLRGCDFRYMDTLKDQHRLIQANTIIIWGIEDVTFPLAYGIELAGQFQNASFHKIENASLMPHEEKPEEILGILDVHLIQ